MAGTPPPSHTPSLSPSLPPPPTVSLDFVYVIDGDVTYTDPGGVGGPVLALPEEAESPKAPSACAVPASSSWLPSPPLPGAPPPRAPYTEPRLSTALQTAGVKPKVARKVRDEERGENPPLARLRSLALPFSTRSPLFFPFLQATKLVFRRLDQLATAAAGTSTPLPTTARIRRAAFNALVTAAVGARGQASPSHAAAALSAPDLALAAALVERRLPLVVLIAGTSGSGKSTLASLLAGRLGGAAVLSTDAVRGVLRGGGGGAGPSASSSLSARLLAASTYEAGAALDEEEEGGGRSGASPPRRAATPSPADGGTSSSSSSSSSPPTSGACTSAARARAVRGWAAQAALVQPALTRAIAAAAARGEPVVVEGAHISIPWALNLMREMEKGGGENGAHGGPSSTPRALVIPFLAFISNAAKHGDRLAVRAKYMTASESINLSLNGDQIISSTTNRYVRHLAAIRAIQAALLKAGGLARVPAVDNTAVDRSVGAMHAAVLGCLRRAALGGESLISGGGGESAALPLSCPAVAAEFSAATASLWSSKVALRLIRERVAARRARGCELEGGLAGLRVEDGTAPPPLPPAPSLHRPGSDGDDDAGGEEEEEAQSEEEGGSGAAVARPAPTPGPPLPSARAAFAAAAAASAAGASMSEGASDFYAPPGGGPRAGRAPGVAGGGAFSSDDGGAGHRRRALPVVEEA